MGSCCAVAWAGESWLPLSSQGTGQSLGSFLCSGELVTSVSGSFRTQSQFFLDTLTFTWEELKPREVEQCARDHTGLQTAAPLPSCPSQACVDKSNLLCHPLSPTRSGLALSLPSLPPGHPKLSSPSHSSWLLLWLTPPRLHIGEGAPPPALLHRPLDFLHRTTTFLITLNYALCPS